MIRKLYILRGLPGSGKTTLASKIREKHDEALTCSIDSYFYRSGVWTWSDDKITEAWDLCDMQFNIAIGSLAPVIIIDNVNFLISHFEKYAIRAETLGYEINIVETDSSDIDRLLSRGRHNVPRQIISSMIEKWEKSEDISSFVVNKLHKIQDDSYEFTL